ncbi:MAG: beta-ketoacyl-ACP synthase [Burkholderiales bacterium]|nr:beta-ketoacyl-ACP synthase [Burkholderiales bacterium]
MQPLFVNAYTAVTAVGAGRAATCEALRATRSGLAPNDFPYAPVGGYVGRVAGVEAARLPAALAGFDCRNHRLAWLALGQDGFADAVAAARARHGAARIATIVGTSTSGILETELGYRARDPATGALPPTVRYATAHNFAALGAFVREACALRGPMLTISTACSSSAKVFATAARWFAAGLCDAAVVAGVDSLCGTTLYGFASLQLVSSAACRPFDARRDGLSLGEAAGFALLERAPTGAHRVALAGYGESVDAYHMSAPHPEGCGAALAMAAALERSGRAARDVDCVQAHGTATRNNDAVEARAIARVVGDAVPVTSIKGHVGHTLGAAGILGAVAALLSIEHGFIPGTANTRTVDPACGAGIQLASVERPVAAVLVNALGFGGNNASLVFARTP